MQARMKSPGIVIPDAITDERLFTPVRLAGCPALQRSRTRRPGPHGSRHPAQRPDRSRPDGIWDEAARHYDEKQLAELVLWIATGTSSTASTSPPGKSLPNGPTEDPSSLSRDPFRPARALAQRCLSAGTSCRPGRDMGRAGEEFAGVVQAGRARGIQRTWAATG